MNEQPILVLLPGFDGSGRLYVRFCEQFSDIKTIILTYPPDKALTYNELCEHLESQLPDDRFVLFGESFGGPLAMLLSEKAGPKLAGIILCVTFIKNPRPYLTKIIRPILRPNHLQRGIPRWYVRTFLLNGNEDEFLMNMIMSANHGLTADVIYTRLREIADIDVTHIVKECDLPILYLRATRDRLVYKNSMELIQKYGQNVQAIEYDSPHMLLNTHPKKVASKIRQFVKEVSART